MTTPTYDMLHDATWPVLDLPPGTELIHGFDKYIIIAPIETVNGSHVYDAYNIEQAIRVVLKVVDWTKANRALYGTVSQPIIEDGQMRPSYASELQLLSYVRHENIARLLDTFCYEVEDSEATWLVMVFETHGVLSTVVQTSESRTDIVSDSWNLAMVCASPAWHQIFMGEDTTRYIFCQVVEAVRYLFSEAIVHQDLILENILVDPQLRIKLANLTSAIWHHPNAMVSFKAGTVDYWPPEMRQDDLSDDGSVGQHNLAAAEIYALGCILLELVQPRGHRIYDLEYIPENPKKLSIIALEVLDADGPPNERWSPEGWEHCRRLILNCRDDDWRRRPTIDELLRNAWLVPEVQGMF